MNERDLSRSYLKRGYKIKRKQDGLIGRQMHKLRTENTKNSMKELRELQEEPLFRDTFPTFASFYEFVKEHGFTKEEVMEE